MLCNQYLTQKQNWCCAAKCVARRVATVARKHVYLPSQSRWRTMQLEIGPMTMLWAASHGTTRLSLFWAIRGERPSKGYRSSIVAVPAYCRAVAETAMLFSWSAHTHIQLCPCLLLTADKPTHHSRSSVGTWCRRPPSEKETLAGRLRRGVLKHGQRKTAGSARRFIQCGSVSVEARNPQDVGASRR